MARYVIVPDPVQVLNFDTGEPIREGTFSTPFTLFRYLVQFAFPDEKLGRHRKDRKAVKRVTEKFRDTKPGEEIEVESDDWERIRAVLEETSRPYNANLMSQLTDFEDAWFDAPEKRREKKEASGEEGGGGAVTPLHGGAGTAG